MTQADWPEAASRVVARLVRRARDERKMSAQQLADRCAELGHPIARSVIANLENNRREAVTVAELAILGAALDVPPALLMYDLRSQDEAEMLPGNDASPWTAYRWFIGEEPRTLPGVDGRGRRVDLDDVDFEQWQRGREPLQMLREHVSLTNALEFERSQLDGELNEERREQGRRRVREAAGRLAAHRSTMRGSDVEPPELPADLARIMSSAGARP